MSASRFTPEQMRDQPGRPETGVMQFRSDWPGVFIRGDNAFAFSMALKTALALGPELDPLTRMSISGLSDLLSSCDARTKPEPQLACLTSEVVRAESALDDLQRKVKALREQLEAQYKLIDFLYRQHRLPQDEGKCDGLDIALGQIDALGLALTPSPEQGATK